VAIIFAAVIPVAVTDHCVAVIAVAIIVKPHPKAKDPAQASLTVLNITT